MMWDVLYRSHLVNVYMWYSLPDKRVVYTIIFFGEIVNIMEKERCLR